VRFEIYIAIRILEKESSDKSEHSRDDFLECGDLSPLWISSESDFQKDA